MTQEAKGGQYPAANLKPGQQPDDPGEGYELVKGLIFDQVYKFHNRFGGEIDDLTSEANVAFVMGHEQFCKGVRPNGTPLDTTYATEIRRWVWYEMFDQMRTKLRQYKANPVSSLDAMEGFDVEDEQVDFDAAGWAEELADDARYAVCLVLMPNPEVVATAVAKGGQPRNFRSTVRQHLTQEGWNPDRINNAFEEIRGALG